METIIHLIKVKAQIQCVLSVQSEIIFSKKIGQLQLIGYYFLKNRYLILALNYVLKCTILHWNLDTYHLLNGNNSRGFCFLPCHLTELCEADSINEHGANKISSFRHSNCQSCPRKLTIGLWQLPCIKCLCGATSCAIRTPKPTPQQPLRG